MKTFKNYTNQINEKVYGKLATVYHRTEAKDIIKNINVKGFKTGYGNMYGPGVYCTYNLKSQLKGLMDDTYGSLIIKSKVNLYRYLIFNKDIAEKVYGKINGKILDIEQQWKLITSKPVPEVIKQHKDKRVSTTSVIALKVSKDKEIQKIVNGLVFTGSRDGDVVVSYNKNSVTPISYNSTFNNPTVLDTNKWNKTLNKQLVATNFYDTMAKTNKDFDKYSTKLSKITKIYDSIKAEIEKGTITPKGKQIEIKHKNGKFIIHNALINDYVPEVRDLILKDCEINYISNSFGNLEMVNCVIHDCNLSDITDSTMNNNIFKGGNIIIMNSNILNVKSNTISNVNFSDIIGFKKEILNIRNKISNCSFTYIIIKGGIIDNCNLVSCNIDNIENKCIIKNSKLTECSYTGKLENIELINCNITTEELYPK